MKEIDRVLRDGKTGRTWTVGFLSWRPTADANYPDLRGRMRLGCTPASGNKIYIELSAAEARNDDAVLEEIRKDPNA
jgi:hypothetical protein